ncbi:MAG TPA: hemolysin [Cytophagales bacterium]|jgi:putative hemolysin|nr:hemolysin [Cytophagales bacterium]
METQFTVNVIVSLFFSAFFSGIEIAFISADKLKIELSNQKGELSGKILSRFLNNPSRLISTTLIGNNIALVVYGIFMAYILEPKIEMWLITINPDLATDTLILLLQTLLATIIVLVTAEFLPKSLFIINPNKLLSVFAVPMQVIYYLLYPFVFIIVNLTRIVIEKILRLPFSEDKPVFGLTDLNEYIKNLMESESESDEQEIDTKIFANALEFKTIKVRDCMVPRPELEMVEIEEGIEALKQAFIKSGYSKILVYKDSVDDIIGYCNSLELFKKPKDIESIINPIIIVPETMLASELLIQLITERKSIALVVDEFGGTSGIVTTEDLIEEIFGDIQDEHDEIDLIEQKIDANNYILSARFEIDYLNDKYGWNLPTGEYDTLGGLILSITEDIPEINEKIVAPPYTFVVLSIENNRINNVKLKVGEKSWQD